MSGGAERWPSATTATVEEEDDGELYHVDQERLKRVLSSCLC